MSEERGDSFQGGDTIDGYRGWKGQEAGHEEGLMLRSKLNKERACWCLMVNAQKDDQGSLDLWRRADDTMAWISRQVGLTVGKD